MRLRNVCVLLVGLMVVAVGMPALAGTGIFQKAALTDLNGNANPTDGAWAVASATVTEGQTVVVINVKDISAEAGTTFGAHVHVGPCVEANGAAALGHYNAGGGVSPGTEVWLDFTVTGGGTGHATAIVPFAIEEGTARSIVIHALPTAPDGAAGARLACLPLEF